MDINTLNEHVNNLAVLRLEIQAIESEREKLIEQNDVLKELQIKAEGKKAEKEQLQRTLLEIMQEAQVQSWKTDFAIVSKAKRESLIIDPAMEKPLLQRLKNGEVVDGFQLRTTEYISIRNNSKK